MNGSNQAHIQYIIKVVWFIKEFLKRDQCYCSSIGPDCHTLYKLHNLLIILFTITAYKIFTGLYIPLILKRKHNNFLTN